MILDDNIVVFANTYSCPLNKRLDDCVFNKLTQTDKNKLYETIVKINEGEKKELVDKCQDCQGKNKF